MILGRIGNAIVLYARGDITMDTDSKVLRAAAQRAYPTIVSADEPGVSRRRVVLARPGTPEHAREFIRRNGGEIVLDTE